MIVGQKKTSDGLFFNERGSKMEREHENERGRLSAEQAVKMLKEENVDVTLEQAKMIVEFLRKLANLTVSNYLKNKSKIKKWNKKLIGKETEKTKNHECSIIYQSKYR